MNRLELSDLLMTGLAEGQSNDVVISHIKSIVIKIDNYLPLFLYRNDNTLTEPYLENNDLAETIRDITNKEYYYAITRLDDFLLRGKKYAQPLSFYEFYIIKSFLDGIVLSST